MAATDTKRTGLQNQKRAVSVMVSEELASAAADGVAVVTDGSIIGTLPEKSLIIGVWLVVTVASAASDTLDVVVGTDVVANEISADATGAVSGTVVETVNYRPTGGDITVKNGAEAVDSDFRGRVVIEYIELDKVTGEYTLY